VIKILRGALCGINVQSNGIWGRCQGSKKCRMLNEYKSKIEDGGLKIETAAD
jgi:hypothetical protein